jgi:hypothetical protein
MRRSMCDAHAATGSCWSSRRKARRYPHSLSTSGSPNAATAHPSVGQGTIVQFTAPLKFAFSREASWGIRSKPARAVSTSARRSGSGSPTIVMLAELCSAV